MYYRSRRREALTLSDGAVPLNGPRGCEAVDRHKTHYAETEEPAVLENRFVRAGAFFAVTFGIPVAIDTYFRDVEIGIRIGTATGIIFAVMSQFFEPRSDLTD